MNELVEKIKNNDFPVLFKKKNIKKLGFNENDIEYLLKDALMSKYIIKVYEDIYTLARMYRKSLVSECVLAQMLVPESYISTYYILSDVSWIPEAVYNITSITNNKKATIDTEYFGSYKFENIKDGFSLKGVYLEENDNGEYLRAKPLKALCDYILIYKKEWDKIGYLVDHLRINYDVLEELTSSDFDEIQGSFGIKNVENFIRGVRKELRI